MRAARNPLAAQASSSAATPTGENLLAFCLMSECATLTRAFFDESLQDSPVTASQLGVDGYDDRLDDLSEAAFEDRRRRAFAWLTRFEQRPDDACATFDDRIDPDLIRSNLRARPILADWQMWRRHPQT